MRVFKVGVSFSDAPANIYRFDGIEYDGKVWIVPRWLDPPGTEKTRPTRIILLDKLKHQKLKPGHPFGDYLVNEPIPKSVLYDEISSQLKDKYGVIDQPQLLPGLGSVQ